MATPGGRGTFAALLQKYRLAAGLSQEELAELADLSRRGISDLERGQRRSPHPSTVRRLADALALTETERAQLLVVGRGHRAPAIDPEWPASGLPAQPCRLIDRDEELRNARAQLLDEYVRLLTLTGTGGAGKTRLAIAVADSLASEFTDGTCFVDLSAIRDPALVMPTVARAFGLTNWGHEPLMPYLQTALRARHILLVLDNFEHVLPAALEVAELVGACPDLKILVTSREPLHLRWEHRQSVPPLATPRRRVLELDVLARIPSVALFVDRARAAQPAFSLDQRNARKVADVCDRLDGLPLAIELAAAHCGGSSLTRLLPRLQQHLDLLSGARDQPTRHRTLRAAIDWSYELLTEPEQAIFRRLSVFTGSCTLDAAQAVCAEATSSPASVALALGSLVDKHLIQLDERLNGDARFWLLATIGEYALERLQQCGEEDNARRSHADFFAALAQQAEPQLRGGKHYTQWLDRLDADRENLRQAVFWCADADEQALGLRLAGSAFRYWYMRGSHEDGQALLRHLQTFLGGERARTRERARGLTAAAVLSGQGGKYVDAVAMQRESLDIWSEVGEQEAIARAHSNLGVMAAIQSDTATAERHLREAARIAGEAASPFEEARALLHLGDVKHERGETREAGLLYEQAAGIFKAVDDQYHTSLALSQAGGAALADGDLERARIFCEEGLRIQRELGDPRGLAESSLDVGWIRYEQHQLIAAQRLFVEVLTRAREFATTYLVPRALEGLAVVAAARGRYSHALRLAGAASAIRSSRNLRYRPHDWSTLEHGLAAAWQAADRAAADTAWALGAAMTHEEAIGFALGGPRHATGRRVSGGSAPQRVEYVGTEEQTGQRVQAGRQM
jgi:predicted ATPase/DNA-binding XRE family transcriptional regulator